MPSADYMEYANALQYTGSNGAEMATYVGVPIVTDAGGVLELGAPGAVVLTFNTGDWYDKKYNAWWAAADFPARHVSKAAALQDTIFDPTALNASVSAKLGKVDLVSISVPTLLLLATADRVITWNRPFSNTSYDLSYAMDASTIGRITCAPVAGTKTTTGITIRITASLLAVAVLGVVHVLAIGT